MPETVADPANESASGEQGTATSGEETSTTPDSPASGGPDPSGGEDFEAKARTWQSRYDQAQAELTALKASQATSSETNGRESTTSQEVSDPMAAPITQADLIETLTRVDQLRGMSADLQKEFPHASKSVFDNPLSYESPEAFLATARKSHEERTADFTAVREQADKEWIERLGPLAKQFQTPAAGSEDNAVSSTLTIATWNAMSLTEKDAFYRDNQEAVDKLLGEYGG